jgi:hypothetical protein
MVEKTKVILTVPRARLAAIPALRSQRQGGARGSEEPEVGRSQRQGDREFKVHLSTSQQDPHGNDAYIPQAWLINTCSQHSLPSPLIYQPSTEDPAENLKSRGCESDQKGEGREPGFMNGSIAEPSPHTST